jgi:hypothetical protein
MLARRNPVGLPVSTGIDDPMHAVVRSIDFADEAHVSASVPDSDHDRVT